MDTKVGFKYPRHSTSKLMPKKRNMPRKKILDSDNGHREKHDEFAEFVRFASLFVTKNQNCKFDLKLAFCLDQSKALLINYKKWINAIEGKRSVGPEVKISWLLESWKNSMGKECTSVEKFIAIFDLDTSNGLNDTISKEIQNRVNKVSMDLIEVKDEKDNLSRGSRSHKKEQPNKRHSSIQSKDENANLKDLILDDDEFREYLKDEDSFKEFLIFQKFQNSCGNDDGIIDDTELNTAMEKFQENRIKKETLLKKIQQSAIDARNKDSIYETNKLSKSLDTSAGSANNSLTFSYRQGGATESTNDRPSMRRRAPNPNDNNCQQNYMENITGNKLHHCDDKQMIFKIALVGDQMVGKTSIINRRVHSHFDSMEKRTECVDYTTFTCQLGRSIITLQLWDTFGHEGPKTVDPLYLRDANAVVIMYDITRKRTFQNMTSWIRWAKRHIDDNCELMIIGNKLDLSKNRAVTEQESWQLAREHSTLWFETSACDGSNVKDAFDKMAENLEFKFRKNLRRLQSRKSNSILEDMSVRNNDKSCVIS